MFISQVLKKWRWMIKIPFKNWFDQDYIASYIRNELQGTWINSSGCWSRKYLKIWFNEDKNTTYVHFPCDFCFAWKGNAVKDVSSKIKYFIKGE